MKRHGSRDSGLTLIELVAALAIFSVIAVMSLQLLTSALFNRTQITAAAEAATEVMAFAAVVRRDIRLAAPVAPGQGRAFEATGDGSLRVMTGAGVDELSDPVPSVAQVAWSFDRSAGALLRASGDAAPIVVLSDVDSVLWRAMTVPGGWRAADEWRGDSAWSLPDGVEVRLSHRSLGEVRVVVAR